MLEALGVVGIIFLVFFVLFTVVFAMAFAYALLVVAKANSDIYDTCEEEGLFESVEEEEIENV